MTKTIGRHRAGEPLPSADWNDVALSVEKVWTNGAGGIMVGTGPSTDPVERSFELMVGRVSVRDPRFGAVGNGTTDDTAAFLAALAFATEVFVPEGTYLIKSWLPLRSGQRLHGTGPLSIIYNDKTSATIDKRACLLVGNHHPALMASQTAYILNNIAQGDATVTATTAGDAANFAVGELAIVGSNTNVSGVPRHAQLNKIMGIASGVITLRDPIEAVITDARIWKISGVDSSTGNTPIAAVENVIVENLGFKGRAAIATKAAVYGGIFRNLTMHDVTLFFGTNMLTNVLIENLSGQYCGRYLEFAFNSYNVTARNWKGRFTPPAGLQAGESQVLPIHLGEQPYRILLDDVQCHVDARFTLNSELAQVKGSQITLHKCDWRHNGTSGSYAISVPDSGYTGFNYERVVFEDCRLAAPGKARVALVGGATANAQNPKEVHFRGGEINESVTGESLWFQAGSGFSCSMRDRTGKNIKVSTTARYPMLNGYRRF